MSKKEIDGLHEKLDKIIESNNNAHNFLTGEIQKLEISVTRMDEHQKTINGSVARHEKKFLEEKKVTNELFKEFKNGFTNQIKDVNTIAQLNRGQLTKYGGIAIGITIFISAIGFLFTLKSQGYI